MLRFFKRQEKPSADTPNKILFDPRTFASPEVLIEDLRILPSGPRILPELLSLLSSHKTNIDAVIHLIRIERALAARVLSVSNNVQLCGRGTCTSLEDAVGRLGFEQVHRLVINSMALELAGKNLPSYGMSGVQLWTETVTVAIGAEIIAEAVGLNPDTAYTLGLLHGVGMVVIDSFAGSRRLELNLSCAGFPHDTTQAETATLGFTHAEVGAALLRKWNYPAELFDPIRWQYHPEKSLCYPRFASVLLLSRWIRDGIVRNERIPLPLVATDRYLGLTFKQMQELTLKTKDKLAHSCELLSLV
jgi:HD-like signal output (HDOD) protein